MPGRHFRNCSVVAIVPLIVSLVGFQQTRARPTTSPHDLDIFGVRIGMDVATALKAIWENANNAQPGKEKPDAKKNEGKDVRVLYKLKDGNLEILFADGTRVKEMQIQYAKALLQDDLKLLDSSGNYNNAGNGTQRDDRYSVGFTSNDKKERFWWRDVKMDAGYRVRVGFISEKLTKGGLASKEIVRKIITVVPEDKDKFNKAVAAQ
ncbi:MAG: hypothetical protein M3R67_05815 [Acidobacteriota bacterium]|nr:hypothetical protein [Acidobacteriota bacterium]